MKEFSFYLFLMFFCFGVNAQSGTWVWMNGSNTANSSGNYGIQGVASTSNSPPGIYQASQWKDNQGNFWIFSGDFSNDLWKYDPLANTWTWVKGSTTANEPGIYGTLGVPSITNTPGGRTCGSATWTDSTGDLWLFGGGGFSSMGQSSSLNDLWRYHIASNEWTWMGGSNLAGTGGDYGNLYQPSSSSLPRARWEINTAWIDGNNNLWLFGGFDGGESCNDIWCYNIAIGQWAWMGGGQILDARPNYGSFGIESPTNTPGSRESYTHWVDGNYLYLTGGEKYEGGHGNLYNDVWRFNLNTNYWTWVGGDSGVAPPSQYSHYCSTSYGDMPRGRYEHRSTQVNGCPSILFMCGGSFGKNGADSALNDLWSFDLSTMKWRWVSGDSSISPSGTFGVKGRSSNNNMPPGTIGACFWSDNNGNLWLWGGFVPPFENPSNAMWKYTPDLNCFPTGTTFSNNLSYQLSATILCPGDSAVIRFTGNSSISILPNNAVIWLDSLNAILKPDTSTIFTAIGTNACGSYVQTNFTIRVSGLLANITADKTFLCAGDTETICVMQNQSNYAWNSGQNSACISVTQSGNYKVTITDVYGCRVVSDTIGITFADASLSSMLSDTVICKGDSVLLNFSGDSSLSIEPNSSTAWINNSDVFLKPDSTTTYRITGITPCGTAAFEDLTIHIAKGIINITPDNISICPGDTTQICAPSGFAGYRWNNNDTTACISVIAPGNYYLTISEMGGCSVTSDTVIINQYTRPQSIITEHNDTLTGSGGVSYQWLFNNVTITGAISSVYVANASGTYSLEVVDSNGCNATTSKVITITGISDESINNNINIFPNPTNTGWQLAVSNDMLGSTVEVFDVTGRLIFKSVIENRQSFINWSNNANGVYELRISWNGYSFIRKLVKM